MELKKEIQTSGNSAVIRLTAEQMKLYELTVGDVIFVNIETEKAREEEEKAFSRLAGTGGGHVQTAEEKAHWEEIIKSWKKRKADEKKKADAEKRGTTR